MDKLYRLASVFVRGLAAVAIIVALLASLQHLSSGEELRAIHAMLSAIFLVLLVRRD